MTKMWHCASLCLILIVAVWVISYGLMKRGSESKIEVNIIRKAEIVNGSDRDAGKGVKVRHHVPKFMLDLYEKSKSVGKDNSEPDVVRSVVPTHAGKMVFCDFFG